MAKEIIFIIDDVGSTGGVTRVTAMIANELVKDEKYNVTVISIAPPQKIVYYFDFRIKVLDLGISGWNIRKHTLLLAYRLRKMFKKDFSATFVVADVGHSIPTWLGLRHLKKAKMISWSHTNFFNGSKWGFSGFGKRLVVKDFNYVVVLTKEDMGYYKKILNATNIVQIYNPRDDSILKDLYKADSKKIISCGRLHPVKGFDLLIQVAQKVFHEVDDWNWDIYGNGPEFARLQKMINDFGLDGKVNLKGYTKDILKLYEDYSLDVFTSKSEGCPMALIEAQAAGLPVISFDFKCGPRDLIVDGVNGYIINDWDINEMSKKILEFISNRDLRISFAQNATLRHSELELSFVMDQWKKIL